MKPLIVGISGASGVMDAQRFHCGESFEILRSTFAAGLGIGKNPFRRELSGEESQLWAVEKKIEKGYPCLR
jgi:hypothetical protein